MVHWPSGEASDQELVSTAANIFSTEKISTAANKKPRQTLFLSPKNIMNQNGCGFVHEPSSITLASTAFAHEGTMPSRISSSPVKVLPSCGIAARPGAGLIREPCNFSPDQVLADAPAIARRLSIETQIRPRGHGRAKQNQSRPDNCHVDSPARYKSPNAVTSRICL